MCEQHLTKFEIMCFGLAPGFVLRDEIAEELLEQHRDADTTGAASTGTPAFATDEAADADLLTGGAADADDSTKTPR